MQRVLNGVARGELRALSAKATTTTRTRIPKTVTIVRNSALTSAGLGFTKGAILTSRHPLTTGAEKRAAGVHSGAVAVDMESAGVAQIAALNKLPFVAVRAIIDTAGDTLPRAVMGAGVEGRVRLAPLILGIVRSPREIAPLMRLAKRYRAAIRALAAVARTGALAPLAFGAAHSDRIA